MRARVREKKKEREREREIKREKEECLARRSERTRTNCSTRGVRGNERTEDGYIRWYDRDGVTVENEGRGRKRGKILPG